MKDFNVNIGKRIRQIRESQGKTRDQVAEIADISPQFLFYIEIGQKSMTAKTIVNLADALNVTTDYILLGCGNRMSKIVENLEGLPTKDLELAEKFLEMFSLGVRHR